ncbi:MAG: CxxC-x17-CxxC domain-containing protein [bacterium]
MFDKFSDRSNRSFAPSQKFQGNWKCADCGAEITELPFQPSPDRPVRCHECHMKQRSQKFGR